MPSRLKETKSANRFVVSMKQLMPAKVIQSRLHRRAFIQVADKIGLVYFGYVDQRQDDHRLVRGLTVSPKQRDNNYCIGSFNDYDITMLERTNNLAVHGKGSSRHSWIILSIDLHNSVDLPHAFLGLKTHSEAFYSQLNLKFPHFHAVPLKKETGYSASFLHKYTLYSSPAQALSAERLFRPEVSNAINERFGNLTIEISEGVLYLYAEHQRPTPALLEKMIQYGIWLASIIDANEQEKS